MNLVQESNYHAAGALLTSATRTVRSYCRICTSNSGVAVSVQPRPNAFDDVLVLSGLTVFLGVAR